MGSIDTFPNVVWQGVLKATNTILRNIFYFSSETTFELLKFLLLTG